MFDDICPASTAKARLETRNVLDCRRCFYRETKASSRSFGGSDVVERLLRLGEPICWRVSEALRRAWELYRKHMRGGKGVG